MGRLTGLLGLATMLGLAYLFSSNRRAIRLKTVGLGLVLQFVFAIFVLRFNFGQALLEWAGHGVEKFLEYSFAGSQLVFGELGRKGGSLGMIFAFQVLPTVIFISAFFAVLYHYGVMQFIIRQMAKVMIRMGASGAESLDVAASIFMGQTEAPLTIRPYLPSLTRSELMTVMTAGMAHVSGGIMGAYILYGVEAKHLLSAVIMTAPGTILMAKMFVPETEEPVTKPHDKSDRTKEDIPSLTDIDPEAFPKDENVLGAITRGTIDGLHLALNIAAMLISFLALIALVNGIFGGIHNHIFHWFPSSLEQVFGVIFAPIAFVIGIPWQRVWHRGQSSGNAHGDQRTGGLRHAGRTEGHSRSPLLRHRDFRAMRLRKLQFDWNSDRRHQRPCAQQARRAGEARLPCHDCGHHGQSDVSFDCGHPAALRLCGRPKQRGTAETRPVKGTASAVPQPAEI